MTPLPPFDVLTPLGPATCIGICNDSDNVEWVTFIKSTGEPWFWRNYHIRSWPSVTNARPEPSPFTHINMLLAEQISRYKQNGWLK